MSSQGGRFTGTGPISRLELSRGLGSVARSPQPVMLHTNSAGRKGMSVSIVGAVPGTLIVIGIVVLGVVLLAYAVYFFLFKKNLGSED